MSTLYNIEQNLIDLFEQIEDAEGEITDEQYEQLELNENNLKEKLNDYRLAINEWESDINKCKLEAKRLTNVVKVRENRITRLKTAMTNAVLMFGQSGKTNKFIELENCRLSTRNSNSVEINENRVDKLLEYFIEVLSELNDNNILATGEHLDLEGILCSINAIARSYHPANEEFIPYTIDDLNNIKFEIKIKHSIGDILKWHKGIAEYIGDSENKYEISEASSKTELKNMLLDEESEITCANISNKTSLLIK